MVSERNYHATLITIDGQGILIRGSSGSGKSLLALALIDRCQLGGVSAALVSDDQVLLAVDEMDAKRLIGFAAEPIKGLVEVRGYGPARIGYEMSAKVDLVVSLVNPEDAPRYAPDLQVEIAGVVLPELMLAEKRITGNLMAVLAKLGLGPFRSSN